MAARKAPTRPSRAAVFRRWLAVAVVGLIAFLYYRPFTHYLETRGDVARADARVRTLAAEQTRLQRRLVEQTSTEALIREARRLAYVKPGERLFIVHDVTPADRAR